MIKLQDFAKEQGVTDRAIQKHLKKHEKELEGHFERQGPNGTWLDDYACEFIRTRMIKQQIVLGDDYYLRELESARAEIDKLKDKLIQVLEERDSLRLKTADFDRLEADNSKKDELLLRAEKTAQELSQKLAEANTRPISFKEYWQRRK